jgi:hypothetical protein
MDPAVDLTKLSVPAQRILDPKAPPQLRAMGAKGIAPGLKPHEALTIIALLTEAEDQTLAASALATLDKLPQPVLAGGLTPELPAGVLDALAPRYAKDVAVMEKILSMPQILMSSVVAAARAASEAVAELIATNEERLLKHPEIIEKLYLNKATRMSTADRMIELAVRNKIELTGIPAFKEAASAIADELINEPSPERNFDDIQFIETDDLARKTVIDPSKQDTHHFDAETGQEIVEENVKPLYQQLAELSISKRIRRAQVGTVSERMLLVRDTDRRVAVAAIKSPAISESEVQRISQSRAVSEDVLRVIANNREWTRSHQIKFNLVNNPRCPFAFAARLIPHLRDHELKALARSKNVTGAVSNAAEQQLSKKSKQGA